MGYNLNQVAMITGLTTRTLRNHLKLGILTGEKADGNWCISEEGLDNYLANASVKQAIASKQNAVIYDFLGDSFKKSNRVCTIMDLAVSSEEAASIAKFFCTLITEHGRDIEFRFVDGRNFARFVLSGSEDQVHDLMKAYYDSDVAADA